MPHATLQMMRFRVIGTVIFLVCLIAAGAISASLYFHRPAHVQDLLACFQGSIATNSVSISNCLHAMTASLLNTSSATAIMNYTIASTSPQTVVTNCHLIGHILGYEEFKKTGSLESALSECTSVCNYGCIHGAVKGAALQELGLQYDSEDIVHADISKIQSVGEKYCANSGSVCHGMGHVLFIATDNSFDESLSACDAITQSDSKRDRCYGGVFMESSDFVQSQISSSTNPLAAKNPTYPCLSVKPEYQQACFLYWTKNQIPILGKADVTPLSDRLSAEVNTCSTLQGDARAYCFKGMGFDGFSQGNLDNLSLVKQRCSTLQGADRDACAQGVEIKYIFFQQYTDALAYCDSLTGSSQKACYWQRDKVL